MRDILTRLIVKKEKLTQDEAYAAMKFIMDGEATPSQIAAFLSVLRYRGETVDEVAGCALAMALAVSLVERFLLHIYSVLPMAQHGDCDAECEPRRLDQLRLELSLEVCIHRDCSL